MGPATHLGVVPVTRPGVMALATRPGMMGPATRQCVMGPATHLGVVPATHLGAMEAAARQSLMGKATLDMKTASSSPGILHKRVFQKGREDSFQIIQLLINNTNCTLRRA